MSKRKSTAKLKFRKNLFYDVIFKNTILDQFTHLTKYVVSCLESVDDNANDTAEKPCGIIYCKNRKTVDVVAKTLTEQGVLTKAHHGGIEDRDKVQAEWMAGALPVIAATTSFGGGIAKATVRFVVHWNVPRSVAKYYRESGLAGRDGQLSYCRIYYCKEDATSIESTLTADIDNTTGDKLSQAIRAHDDFMKICNLCETVRCRHKMFSDIYDETAPECHDRCDVCSNPGDVTVAVSIFNRLADGPPVAQATSLIDLESHVNGQSLKLEHPPVSGDPTEPFRPPRNVSPAATVIKEEGANFDSGIRTEFFRPPRNVSPANTVIKEERTDFESFRPPRNVSPANTIIKDEGTEDLDSPNARVGGGNLSDELFEMQTRPPRHLSPARTIIKEELDRPNGLHVGVDWNSHLFAPPRCISPAETLIVDEKPVLDAASCNDVQMSSPLSISSGSATPRAIKSEPKSPAQPPPTNPTRTSSQTGTDSVNSTQSVSSFVTAIKHEPAADRSPRSSSRESRRSLSPTGTIVKDECLSPRDDMTDITEPEDDNLATVSNRSPKYQQSTSASIKRSRSRSSERDSKRNTQFDDGDRPTTVTSNDVVEPISVISSDSDGVRSTEPRPPAPERATASLDEKTRHKLSNLSIERRKDSTPSLPRSTTERRHQKSSSRRRSRSRSGERVKREPDDDRRRERHQKSSSRRRSRSRSNERSYRKSSSRRRSRSRSKERIKRETDDDRRRRRRNSRSRSGERVKREPDDGGRRDSHSYDRSRRNAQDDRRQESSSFGKARTDTHSSGRPDKRRRTSNESDADDRKRSNQRQPEVIDLSSNDAYYSTQPSTSTGRGKVVDRSHIQSVSESPENKMQITDDIDYDYGWEDPAPPKLEPKSKPKTEDVAHSINENLRAFSSKLDGVYDLDVIAALKKQLFEAIDETIAVQSNNKLSELDAKIQKKQDDHMRELFGTDDFDSWDDDPALSNVEVTAKLKPYKSLVPDNIPLIDKMCMKHVANVMKLTPARDRDELIFHGRIKEIENEFQGQTLPTFLLDSLKTEKKTIADLVKKFLMPYYRTRRIEPPQLFDVVTRKICHIFYERFGDANTIQKFIDDLFRRVGKVTSSTELQL